VPSVISSLPSGVNSRWCGEAPVGILAQISATLRRFAAATQLIEQGEANGRRVSLRQALEEAGIKGFVLGKSEGQLRQIGRQRGGQLYRWLLDADLAIKGASSSPARARFVLEQLIARLSAGAAPKRPAPRTLRAGK
jgi:DNA polymerase-3 subunit delta